MKRWLMFLFVICVSVDVISASVVVHNFSVGDSYSPLEVITGEINLTISGERYDGLIVSNDGDSVGLGDFLSDSGVIFDCSPPDCSRNYEISSGFPDKVLSVPVSGQEYVGFVLNGENVVLDSLSFKIESDFDESFRRPLSIEFFEEEVWEFSDFSDSFLSSYWGCYDSINKVEGALIGNSLYCEMVSVQDSGILRVGADVSGVGGYLNMTVYPESGTGAEWKCSYDPSIEEGCVISPDSDEIFYTGDYQVCVSADALTDYRIYEEDVGVNCGFVYDVGPGSSIKDYGIFVRGVRYADASSLGFVDFNDEDIVDAANTLIKSRYKGDCSDGCVLPFVVSGVSQNLRIYEVEVSYTSDYEWQSTDEVYNLEVSPVDVNFSGVLDLSGLGFHVSESMSYAVSLGSYDLFNVVMEGFFAPIILSVFPLNPPAGVSIKFFADVDFNDSLDLSYKWDFGDGEVESTSVPFVVHTYSELSNYSLILEVSSGWNLSSEKSFYVNTVTPEAAVIMDLGLKRNALNSVRRSVDSFASWYRVGLSELIRLDFFESELDRLNDGVNDSIDVMDFVDIAKDLYVMDIPVKIIVNSFNGAFFMTNLDEIDLEPVSIIGGGSVVGSEDEYANAVLVWQDSNVDVSFEDKVFSVLSWSGGSDKVFRVYNFDVSSKSLDESYFVINRPFNELYFREDVRARKAGDSTVIVLPAEGEISFGFYYESNEPTSFFVSPKLSSIVVEANINEDCNFNLVCEKDAGENYENCRSDCKPVSKVVFYIILLLVLVLVFYSVLQIWYKRHYENYLFVDHGQLYNLLMFVTNARARGLKDSRIVADLRKQGWSSERVNYIIKKSRGQRTGMYEIIPFEKVVAFFRNKRARKRESAKVTTGSIVGSSSLAVGGRRQFEGNRRFARR